MSIPVILEEPIVKGAPSPNEGSDGDKRYSYVPNKGLFHFIKYNGKWHSSAVYEENIGAITKKGVHTENIQSNHDIRLAPGKNVEVKEKRSMGTGVFTEGFSGNGWRLRYEDNEYNLELDSLTVRGTLHVYELLLQQLRATNGTVVVTSAGKVDSFSGSAGAETIVFDDPSGHNVCPFATNDIILCQRVSVNAGATVKQLVRRVASVSGKTITVASDVSGQPSDTTSIAKGDDFIRIGNTSTSSRQGGVIITSDLTNAPFVEVFDGVSSWSTWTGTAKIKARLGQLAGISDSDAGLSDTTKFGLYTNDVHLKGHIHATSGKIAGINISSGVLYSDNTSFGASNNGFYLNSDGKFSLKDKLTFDPSSSTLTLSGTAVIGATGWAHSSDATKIDGGDIYAGSVTADRITATTLSSISANLGSITAGSINIGSGSALINADGSAVFTSVTVTAQNGSSIGGFTSGSSALTANNISVGTGAIANSNGHWSFNSDGSSQLAGDRIRFQNDGDITIHTATSASQGIVFYDAYSSGSPSHSGNNWKIMNGSTVDGDGSAVTGSFNFLKDGTNEFIITNTSVHVPSNSVFYLGIGTDADTGFQRDSGRMRVYMVNQSAMYPNQGSTSATGNGYDLGRSTAKWRKLYVVQSNVGDLVMDNQSDARWILREQPDCILARNCKTQKTYKLDMTETSDYNNETWEDSVE